MDQQRQRLWVEVLAVDPMWHTAHGCPLICPQNVKEMTSMCWALSYNYLTQSASKSLYVAFTTNPRPNNQQVQGWVCTQVRLRSFYWDVAFVARKNAWLSWAGCFGLSRHGHEIIFPEEGICTLKNKRGTFTTNLLISPM